MQLQANSIPGNFGDTEDARTAVLADLNPSIPEVELDAFFEHVWPALPAEVNAKFANIVNTVMNGSSAKKRVEQPKIEPQYRNNRWVVFTSDPAESTERENAIFEGLVQIATIIASATESFSNKRVSVFQNSPDHVPSSIWRDNLSRPDGYFILKARNATKAHWIDIVATGEYKKSNSVNDRNDDNRKAIWNMHHTLREDPRRRFTYAFTVENTTMRLWYGSRSDILVSKGFDIMKEPDRLVRFFLTMMFASPTSLGFDPTMQCIVGTKLPQAGDSGKDLDLPQYNIRVGHGASAIVYRTVDLISSVGTNGIQGRGTRVWRVVRADKPAGKPAVLKDSWIDSDRMREGDILEALRSEETTEEQAQSLSEHFLTMITHGDVYIDDKPDTTLSEDVRAALTGQGERYTLYAPDDDKKKRRFDAMAKKPPTGTHHSAQEFRDDLCQKIHTYRTKSRYRIVFEEVCTSLHDETSLASIFGYLGEACDALRTMHELGWVHRDVSTGNILLHTDHKTQRTRVIIADLEYAKKMGPSGPTRSDVRTGTADFMAVEVKYQDYIFKSDRVTDCEPRQNTGTQHQPGDPNAWTLPEVSSPEPEVPFLFNPLHDMEPILWIGTYFVSNKDVEVTMKADLVELSAGLIETPDARGIRLHSQVPLAASMFYTQSHRRVMIMRRGAFRRQMNCLHRSVWPFWMKLEEMRVKLVMRYQGAEEEDEPIPCSVAQGLHEEFRDLFTHADLTKLPYSVSLSVLRSPKLMPATTAPNEAPAIGVTPALKRKRDDLGDAPPDPDNLPKATLDELAVPLALEARKRRRRQPAPVMPSATTPAATTARVTRSQSKAALAGNSDGPRTQSTRNGEKNGNKVKGKGKRKGRARE